MRLIDAKVLYNELAKIEDSTRKEIFKHERSGAEYWMRMGALNQITKLKHFVFDSATVEAKPVVRGEWVEFDIDYGGIPTVGYQCSECGQSNGFLTDFCPNCGCDMRGGKNE